MRNPAVRRARLASGEVAFATLGPASVINVDIDGDGLLDVAILDPSGGRVGVWFGDGSVGLRPAAEPVFPAGDRLDSPVPERLTSREAEVAALLVDGYTDGEIATLLGIGRRTVETHSANVRAKLGLRSRRELLRRGR